MSSDIFSMKKKAPWVYATSSVLQMWQWKSDHFDAQIKSDGNRFIYSLTDTSQNVRHTIESNMAMDFRNAENRILELISKSYPIHLGYREYAGELATTFRINSGEDVDFGPLEGERVIVKVKTPKGEQTVIGPLQVMYHKVNIIADGSGDTVEIPPVLILSVRPEFAKATDKAPTSKGTASRSRTVQGPFTRGCTGKVGYQAGTVEHPTRSSWCPIHKV
jgi:hypothetical protein